MSHPDPVQIYKMTMCDMGRGRRKKVINDYSYILNENMKGGCQKSLKIRCSFWFTFHDPTWITFTGMNTTSENYVGFSSDFIGRRRMVGDGDDIDVISTQCMTKNLILVINTTWERHL